MLISIVVALLSTLLTIFLLNSFASNLGLVDRPCTRKLHKGEVPLVGGLSIFIGVSIGLLTSDLINQNLILFILSSSLIVFIGVLDDKYDLSVRSRLIGQFLVGSILIFGLGDYISTLGNLVSFGEVTLGQFGIVFTLVAILAAINAYNMIDGIDGLLGSISLVSFSSIAFLAVINGSEFVSIISIVISVSLLPFLLANIGIYPLNKLRIFMGDAGSMFIGLSVIWCLVYASQHTSMGEPVFRPVFALFVVAIPLMDMTAIMFRRIQKGQSPFKPDRDHIHHIFMRAGFSSKQALMFISMNALAIAAFGVYGEIKQISEVYMLSIIFILFLGYMYVIKHAWKVTKLCKKIFRATANEHS